MTKRVKNDTHFAEILSGAKTTLILKIIGIIFGYLLIILVSRWYGVVTLGMFTLSVVVINIFVIVSSLGFDSSLVKYISGFNIKNNLAGAHEVYQKAIYMSFPLSILLSYILYIYSEDVATNFFHNDELIFFLEVASLAITPLTIIKLNSASIRGFKKITYFSFLDSVSISLFALMSLLVLSTVFEHNSSVIFSQIIAILITMIVSYVFLTKIMFKKKPCKGQLSYKEVLRLSLPMAITSSLALLMGWMDIIMLGAFRTEEEVGIYSVVAKIAGVGGVILGIVSTTLGPKIAELWGVKDVVNIEWVVHQSTIIVLALYIPILLLIFILPRELLSIFGDEFVIGSTALIVLSLGQLFYAYSGDAGMFLRMTGGQVFLLKLNIFALLLNFSLNFYFINQYGINGAAIGTMIALIVSKIIANHFIKKKYGFNFYWVMTT